MEHVCQSIRDVLELDRHGGTLMVRDDTTAVLVDHELITFHAQYMISTLHPNVRISTHSTDSSSSGFMVVFVYSRGKPVLCSAQAVLYSYTAVCLMCSVVLSVIQVTPHWAP